MSDTESTVAEKRLNAFGSYQRDETESAKEMMDESRNRREDLETETFPFAFSQ